MAKIKKTPRRRKITSKEALEKALHEETDLMEAEILVRARLAETGFRFEDIEQFLYRDSISDIKDKFNAMADMLKHREKVIIVREKIEILQAQVRTFQLSAIMDTGSPNQSEADSDDNNTNAGQV